MSRHERHHRIFFGLLFGLLLSGGAYFFGPPSETATDREPPHHAAPSIDKIRDRIAERRRALDLLAAATRDAGTERPEEDAGRASPSEKKMRRALAEVESAGKFFDRDHKRREIYEALLGDPESIPTAQRILVEGMYAPGLFGDKQAAARVYAIQFLRFAAASGNKEALVDTIRKFLAANSDAAQLDRGRRADVQDLVAGLAAVDPEATYAAGADWFEALGYRHDYVEPFEQGLRMALQSKYSNDQINEKLRSLKRGGVL